MLPTILLTRNADPGPTTPTRPPVTAPALDPKGGRSRLLSMIGLASSPMSRLMSPPPREGLTLIGLPIVCDVGNQTPPERRRRKRLNAMLLPFLAFSPAPPAGLEGPRASRAVRYFRLCDVVRCPLPERADSVRPSPVRHREAPVSCALIPGIAMRGRESSPLGGKRVKRHALRAPLSLPPR